MRWECPFGGFGGQLGCFELEIWQDFRSSRFIFEIIEGICYVDLVAEPVTFMNSV